METALNTLFLMTEGSYLHVELEGFKVELPEKAPRRLPRHNIGSVLVFGSVMVSPQTMGRCAEEGRTITFFDRIGRFLARVEGPVSGNVLLRRAQHEALSSAETTLNLARSFVAGKLRNARAVLLRNARDADADDAVALRDAALEHKHALDDLGRCEEVDEARGVEGTAAAAYFNTFPHMIRSDRDTWGFRTRTRRPPRDPVNALLSFLYAVLTHDCRSALEGVGLDPQVGYLHALRPGRPALALDLMEEFRPLMVDRLVLRLVNRGQVRHRHFTRRKGGAVLMDDDTRKAVLAAYQEMKRQPVEHAVTGRKLPLGLVPHLQARILARTLRGEGPGYVPHLITP
ncbi:MAG: CRISPR-associated endonuclease Cas1 [Calditrichaeota bacterium]|nr:CRISPR-associated endonuclease Cas1 [Calditrichota bacterium]